MIKKKTENHEKFRKSINDEFPFTDVDEFPLKSLSNLAIFSQQNDDKLYPYFLCANSNSYIVEYLKNCKSFKELFYITVYFHSLDKFLTKDLMTLHKAKMKTYLTDLDPKTNFKELLMVWQINYKYRLQMQNIVNKISKIFINFCSRF